MSSFKDARVIALISHSQGLITDEELLPEERPNKRPKALPEIRIFPMMFPIALI